MEFKDRTGKFLNRKKLKVISQTPTEIIVDVERFDEPNEEGTKIDSSIFNAFQTQINQANSAANQASTIAVSAREKSELANTIANNANNTSSTALSNSEKAISDSEFAKKKSLEVESKLADRGAAIIVGSQAQTSVTFKSDPQSQLDNKLEKSFVSYSQKQTISNDDLLIIQDSQSNQNLKVTMKTLTEAVMNASFPVGTIYISTTPTNPSTLFGGVWEEFAQGRTLIGAGTSDTTFTAGAIGGESAHNLTEAEMPSHTHTQNAHVHENTVWNDDHSHSGAVFIRTSKAGISNDYGSTGDHVCGQYGGDKVWRDDWARANAAGVTAHISNVSATATNNNTGGSESHNNLPPYIVTYMWKRIS